jgi:hypothetical protein
MPDPQSKFVAFFQSDAGPGNNRPALKGTFTLPTGQGYAISLWSGEREDGKGLYLNGQAVAQDLDRALKDRHAADSDGAGQGVPPPGLDLQRGHLVLFETPKESLAANPKRPNFYGYAHLAEGYFRIAAWNRAGGPGSGPMITGNIQLNEPRPANDPEPDVPARRGGAPRAARAAQGPT